MKTKKTIRLLATIAVIFTLALNLCLQISAEEKIYNMEDYLISVEVIPNKAKGTARPTSTWNLSSQGKYSFSGTSISQEFYTDYAFTNHNCNVTVNIEEKSSNPSGFFYLHILKQDWINSTLYTYKLERGRSYMQQFGNNLSTSDTFYLAFHPNEKRITVSGNVQ